MVHPAAARIREIAADPVSAMQRLADGGQKVIGLSCPNLPEELPHALGLTPGRIVVQPRPPKRSPEALQTFCCTWVQALLDQGMAGDLAFLHGLTLSCNTCDSLQNLPDIWRRTVERPGPEALHSLRFPVVTGEAAFEMLRAELHIWQSWLEGRAGTRLEHARLEASARLFNRLRAALRELQRAASQGQVGYSLLQAAALAAQTADREEVADLLDAILTETQGEGAPRTPRSTKLVLAGGYLDMPRLFEWLEEHGADVVEDDTCALSRTFEPAMDLDPGDPFEDMARRHLRRSRCPVQLSSAAPRAAALVEKVTRSEAQAVILLPYKGCEPHAFDNVLLAEALDRKKIPHVTLEIEPHLGNWGQITTRLEAFLEMFSEVSDDLFD
jgi:benzoyl-CoA reductase/2-hydroxyglutaryl-CoA dehydratase subunit BcrC/BadD/HgdB